MQNKHKHDPHTRHFQESNWKKRERDQITLRYPEGTAETRTQADVTNQTPAGKDRCPEIAAASASGVPSPPCCDITCLPPHNHDESLWGLPPTAHTAKQWAAMANITTPRSLSPFIFPLPSFWCHDALIFSHSFPYLCLSFSAVLGFCTLFTLSLLYLLLHFLIHLCCPSLSTESWRFNTLTLEVTCAYTG